MPITLPFTFTNGTVADAIQVNANFSALTNAVGGGAGGSLVVGGGAPPSPAPVAGTLVADQVSVKARPVTGDVSAALGLNMYSDASGAHYYAANGAAGMIFAHDIGTGMSRVSITPYPVNSAGPGASLPGSPGALQVVYGTANPFVVIGGSAQIPTTVFPRVGTLLCTDLGIAADPLVPGGDRVARIGFNAYINVATGSWHYQAPGPAGIINTHEVAIGSSIIGPAHIRFSTLEPGNQGDQLPSPNANCTFITWGVSGTALNQTSISLLVNTSGTPTLTQVLVGPANSGPGNNGRVLYVPN